MKCDSRSRNERLEQVADETQRLDELIERRGELPRGYRKLAGAPARSAMIGETPHLGALVVTKGANDG